MKTTRISSILTIVSVLVLFLHGLGRAADKIEVLIVDGQNNHNWKATTPVMKNQLEETGIFVVDVATAPEGRDLDGFAPKFGDYDVVLMNYNGTPWPEATKESFVEYVRGGGGVVIVHAADNSFSRWKEYNEIIGIGGWGGRNEKDGPYIRYRDGKIVRDMTPGGAGRHGRQHEFAVVNRVLHPITDGLPVEWKHGPDELYDRMRGPAKNLTVLATAYAAPETGGSGEHEPVLMTIDYGAGRAFHTVLGHGPRAMENLPGFAVTLARGTEWAGTGTVTLPVPEGLRVAADATCGAGWKPLFDGKSLDGWTQRNGTATYRADAGTVLGKTHEGSPNSFLCTEKNYGDFELLFEVKVDDQLNSGVQIRSRSTAEFKNGRVHGPQVEIATNGTAGFVYGEGLGTGWLSKDRSSAEAKAAFRKGAWNSYRVLAVSGSIKTWVNGVSVANLTDTETEMSSGFIGLQVHGIRRGTGPYEVRWRNIYLREVEKK